MDFTKHLNPLVMLFTNKKFEMFKKKVRMSWNAKPFLLKPAIIGSWTPDYSPAH